MSAMQETTVDVVVLGMGPGGEDAGGKLATAGLEVVGIEAGLVGGECPFWGCVPSKMMVRAANLLAEVRRVPELSGEAEARPDFSIVARRIRDEATDDWDDSDAVERFTGKGGRLVRGRGHFVAPDVVEVGDQRFRARRGVVVATGTTAAVPPIDGLDDTPYWTNREAVSTTECPESIVVLGGGPIGVELGQVFARFGARVTLIDAAERLVPQEEPEVGDILADVFRAEGIDVITGADVESVRHDDAFTVRLAGGREITAERLLVATGRRIDLDAIGVGTLGIDPDADSLPVDDRLRVIDGVWAVGDVTGVAPFTHVALAQSAVAVADILGEPHDPAETTAIPRVTYTDPEIGSVGLTADAAREEGLDVAVGTVTTPSSARGWLHGPGNEGIIRLVADRRRGVLVGATAMGPTGGELLGMLTLAVHAAIPLARLRSMIYAYPTFHRGVEDALRELDA